MSEPGNCTVELTLPVEFDEVLRLAQRPSPSAGSTLLIDARPASSYQGGHIPTSLLLDFPSSLLKGPGNFTYLRDPEDLKKHIAEQLGQDQLDQIVSNKVTVVNSKFDHSLEI
jgi:3-mercaptopyruvate sulfurtransferase SseA